MSLFDCLVNNCVDIFAHDSNSCLFTSCLAHRYANDPDHYLHLLNTIGRHEEVQITLDLLDVGSKEGMEEAETWEECVSGITVCFDTSDAKTAFRLLCFELRNAMQYGQQHLDDAWYSPYDSQVFDSDAYLRWTQPALVVLYHCCLRYQPSHSLEELLLGLLYTEAHLQVVFHFIANIPAIFHPAICYLVSITSPSTRGLHSVVCSVLYRLATLGPTAATAIRDEALAQRTAAGVALRVTLEVLQDPIDFLASVLHRDGEFIFQFLKQDPATGTALAEQIVRAVATTQSPVHRSQCLRLYCCLHLLGCLPAVLPSHSTAFTQVCSDVPTDRYVCLYICFCILTLAESDPASQERGCLALQALARREGLQEPLLQVCAGYHAQQPGQVADWAREQLRVDVIVGPEAVLRAAPLFTGAIVPIDSLVRLLVTLTPPEGSRCPENGASFAVVAVQQLLQRGLFQAHGVDASQWVYDAVVERLPPGAGLPPAVVALLDALVDNTVGPAAGFSMPVWSEYQVLRILNPVAPVKPGDDGAFHPDSAEGADAFFLFEAEDDLSEAGALHAGFDPLKLDVARLNRCVAVAYYVLRVQRRAAATAQAAGYGRRFVEALPLKFLLLQAAADPGKYGAVLPPFLHLVSTQFPHLLAVASLARSLAGLQGDVGDPEEEGSPLGDPPGLKALEGRLREGGPDGEEGSEAVEGPLSLEGLQKAAGGGLWTLLGQRDWWVEEVLPALLPLTPIDSRAMARTTFHCWRRLADHLPEAVFPRTLAVLLPADLKAEIDLAEAPALLTQVDPRLFHDVSLTRLFLEVAQFCLEAADHRTLTLPGPDPAQLQGLALTQRSAVLQFVLEGCAANVEDAEVVAAVCRFLHQQFIDRPAVCRLLHAQTYPLALLPTLADHVPSLHICLDFLPDLLLPPALPRQAFAAHLAAQLLRVYPLPQAVHCATVALGRAQQWGQLLCSPLTPAVGAPTAGPPDEGPPDRAAHAAALAAVLPALCLMARAHPPLTPPLVDLLVELKGGFLPEAVLHAVDETFEDLLVSAVRE